MNHALDAATLSIHLHPLHPRTITWRVVVATALIAGFATVPAAYLHSVRGRSPVWLSGLLGLIAIGGALGALAWLLRWAHYTPRLTLSSAGASLSSAPGRAAVHAPRSAVFAQPIQCETWLAPGVVFHPGIALHGVLPEPLRIVSFDVVGGWSADAPLAPGGTHSVRNEDWQNLARFFDLPVLPLPYSRRTTLWR